MMKFLKQFVFLIIFSSSFFSCTDKSGLQKVAVKELFSIPIGAEKGEIMIDFYDPSLQNCFSYKDGCFYFPNEKSKNTLIFDKSGNFLNENRDPFFYKSIWLQLFKKMSVSCLVSFDVPEIVISTHSNKKVLKGYHHSNLIIFSFEDIGIYIYNEETKEHLLIDLMCELRSVDYEYISKIFLEKYNMNTSFSNGLYLEGCLLSSSNVTIHDLNKNNRLFNDSFQNFDSKTRKRIMSLSYFIGYDDDFNLYFCSNLFYFVKISIYGEILDFFKVDTDTDFPPIVTSEGELFFCENAGDLLKVKQIVY